MMKTLLINSVRKTLLLLLPCQGLCGDALPTAIQSDSINKTEMAESLPQRCDAALAIAYRLLDVDNPAALRYAEIAFESATAVHDSGRLVRSGRILGQLLRRLGNLDRATRVLQPLVNVASRQKLNQEERIIRHALAMCYLYRGQNDLALEQSFQSLKMREPTGLSQETVTMLNNLGSTFYLMGCYRQAVVFFEEAARLDSTSEFVMENRINLALCYNHLHLFDKSSELLLRTKRDYPSIGNHARARLEYAFAHGKFIRGELDSAKYHIERAQHLLTNKGDPIMLIDCRLTLAHIYIRQGFLVRAEQLIQPILSQCQLIPYRNGIERSYRLLSKIYLTSGKQIAAWHVQSALLAVRDSAISPTVLDKINRLQVEFFEKKNRKKIADQQKILELRNQTLRYGAIGAVATTVCLLLISGLALILYQRSVTRQRTAIELELLVRQRTKDLKNHVTTLERAQKERSFLLNVLSKQMKACLATLRGMYFVSRSYELPVDFVDSMDRVTGQVSDVLETIDTSKEFQTDLENASRTTSET